MILCLGWFSHRERVQGEIIMNSLTNLWTDSWSTYGTTAKFILIPVSFWYKLWDFSLPHGALPKVIICDLYSKTWIYEIEYNLVFCATFCCCCILFNQAMLWLLPLCIHLQSNIKVIDLILWKKSGVPWSWKCFCGICLLVLCCLPYWNWEM